MAKKTKKGTKGNAVNYLTRGQAIRKLQVSLKTFRRLCILKGVHPREPRRKKHGNDKTYYHTKDIKWLLHEPIVDKLRDQSAHDKKIRRAYGKLNELEADRLIAKRPAYRLDHLIKERYPSFVDALRDLDDALTMVHLFGTLPASYLKDRMVPQKLCADAKRLGMEFNAYVARTNSLRKVFVSVKGFYYQAEVMGQSITWLAPHQVQQILPNDIDYNVLTTFIEFHQTLLGFVNFKLYHTLGLKYPPVLDPKLEQAAADLEAIIQDFQKKEEPKQVKKLVRSSEVKERLARLPGKIKAIMEQDGNDMEEDSELEEILEEEEGNEDMQSDENMEGGASGGPESDMEDKGNPEDDLEDKEDKELAEKEKEGEKAAGQTVGVAVNDDAALCERLFRGLVFFLGRECPLDPLLFVIRSFGGAVGWQGEGSPIQREDESITYEISDRPTVASKFPTREYIQPQWVFDSCNARVLLPTNVYEPGHPPPPHLSPFTDDQEDGYVPDYALTVKKIQEAADMVRQTASTQVAGNKAFDPMEDLELERQNILEQAEAQEQAYLKELGEEVDTQKSLKKSETGGEKSETGEKSEMGQKSEKGSRQKRTVADARKDAKSMAEIMIPKRDRFVYELAKKREAEKQQKIDSLKTKRDALKKKHKSR